MAEQTTHFHLSLREAADIFNPLSTNDNFATIDAKLYELETKGGIIGYSGTVSANLLTLSGTPTENDTVFKVIPDGDCNTVSFSGAVRQIRAPNGTQVLLKANSLYICYMSSSAMVAIAWPDSVDATSFDGQAPSYYATASEVASVKETAENATQVAQAATTIANNALSAAEAAGLTMDLLYEGAPTPTNTYTITLNAPAENYKILLVLITPSANSTEYYPFVMVPITNLQQTAMFDFGSTSSVVILTRAFSVNGTDMRALAVNEIGSTTTRYGGSIRKVYGIK